MAIFKCKMCGGDLEATTGITVAECEYCGTQQTLPKANDEVLQNLFNRANNLRLKCEFDKAEQIYEKILLENDADPEAHWGLVLCKYGIEYVEDPKTYKRIPTCHRTSYDAVTADAEYLAAIACADTTQRSIYAAEAQAIDEIQKNILNIVKNETPFDVFICYKETDEYGQRTVDSTIANDIYHQLTQVGLKVFYSAITLEDKLGQAYEPYIFAALNSAKVMLVVGTKPQFFTAVWVKNEWSRFLKLMKTDRTKLLIPCYKDMDAYDLPEEFAHLQAQNMGKIGFINDVVRGIKKVTAPEEGSMSQSLGQLTNDSAKQLMLQDNVLYEGAVFAGIPHGYGKAQYANGNIYEGNWNRGKRNGHGKTTYPNGKQWEGEYQNNRPWDGNGTIYTTTSSGVTLAYEGAYAGGMPNGFGKKEYTDAVFEGEWTDGKRNGRGKLTWNAGGQWEGEYQNDRFWDGSGTVYIKDSDGVTLRYEGEYKNGKRNGFGKMRYTDSSYEGQWVDNMRSGPGKLIWDNGGQWEGDFQNDIPWEGSGTIYSKDSNGFTLRYEGEYKNGKRNGFGKREYARCVFEGQWVDGTRNGPGKLTWNDGGQWEGDFKDNSPWNGSGTIYIQKSNEERLRFDGEHKDGKRTGFGKMQYPDCVYEGQWVNDQRQGSGKLIWHDGSQWEGNFLNDTPWNGSGTMCMKDSQGFTLRFEGEYTGGKKNGFGKMQYPDSVYEGQWVNDTCHGQGKLIWNQGGQWEGIFNRGGYWNGYGTLHNANSSYIGYLVDGKYHGPGKILWKKGGQWEGLFRHGDHWKGYGTLYTAEYRYVGNLLNGKFHGQGKEIWDNGDVWESEYQEGVRMSGQCTIYITDDDGEKHCYKGAHRFGKRNGYGVMEYADSVYEGYWADDIRQGPARLTWKAGGQWEGEYWNDEPWNGRGTFYYYDDDDNAFRYEGEFKDGKRNGYGKKQYTDSVYEGYWYNDKEYGPGLLIWNKGGQWKGDFQNGEPWNGYGAWYYEDCAFAGYYSGGKRNGPGKVIWNEGGQWEGEFRDDEPWNGYGIWYHDGTAYTCHYVNGVCRG